MHDLPAQIISWCGLLAVWPSLFYLRAGELTVSPKSCILLTLSIHMSEGYCWVSPYTRTASTSLSAEVTGDRAGGAAQ